MKLSFHGADRDVTGSCHLVECVGKHILIDCGLYQGSREIAEENTSDFGFDPASIDWVLLTHAHLDHCGRLPLLTKRGFRGEIITTAATRERPACHTRCRAPAGGRGAVEFAPGCAERSEPKADCAALHAARRAQQPRFFRPERGLRPAGRPGATFIDAGHILGSASILLELTEAGRRLSLLFSGDLGNAGRPLLRPPATPPHADAVVIETTYGDRLHKPMNASIDELYGAIADTFPYVRFVPIATECSAAEPRAYDRPENTLSVLCRIMA